MRLWLLLPGLLVLGLALYDALYTTVGRGGGPLTKRLSRAAWRFTQSEFGQRVSGYFFSQLGVVVLLLAIFVWTVLLWAGWSLVFMASEGAIVGASSGEPAGAWSRVYFTGYTLVTLGLGDYQPAGSVWQMLTTTASLSGLVVLSLAISYVLPVLQAAVARRATAAAVWGMGETPEEIVRTMWDGDGCDAFEQHLIGLTPVLTTLAQQHLAYPVLHHFRGDRRREALAPSLAALDEALTVTEHGLGGDCLSSGAFHPVRSAIDTLLDRLEEQSVDPASEPPRPPSLDGLRRDGYPVCSDESFREALREDVCDRRRRLLVALVEGEGWSWDTVLDGADDD